LLVFGVGTLMRGGSCLGSFHRLAAAVCARAGPLAAVGVATAEIAEKLHIDTDFGDGGT
jgi:uroporphyrinogen-III synthase